MRRQKGEKAELANDSGIALILVLGILAILVTLATTFAFNMQLEQKAALNYRESVRAKDLAIAGMARVVAELRTDLEADPSVEIASGIYINEVMANTIAYWDLNEAATLTADNVEGRPLDGTIRRNEVGTGTAQDATGEESDLWNTTTKKYGTAAFDMQRDETNEDVGTGDGTSWVFDLA